MIETERGKTVERQILQEGAIGVAHGIEITIKFHMFGIDVGYHGYGGRQFDEATVGLICLNDHPITGAEARVGAIGIDDSTIDYRGVETRAIEHGGDHGGRGGFAMCAGNRHGPFETH